jgi:hypothetical protein
MVDLKFFKFDSDERQNKGLTYKLIVMETRSTRKHWQNDNFKKYALS